MSERDSHTLREEAFKDAASAASLSPYLFLVLDCARLDAGGARYGLDRIEHVLFARGATRAHRLATDGGLTISVPDRRMSSSHARLSRADGGWTLQDLGSTNGTFVDGERVSEARLRDGAVLALGHTVFVFRGALEAPENEDELEPALDRSKPFALSSLVPAVARGLAILERVSRSPLPVLLLGETGSGKELLARAVHETSGRGGAFIPVNCGALPEALVESQLFGHERGAFSGAQKEGIGFVRAADSGTLFLDEIGDLRKSSQASLLRVLEDGEVVPLGSARGRKVDVRVISATNRSLDDLVPSGEFRGDLLARLSGRRHVLTPLRERREDLGSMLATLAGRGLAGRDEAARLLPEAALALLRYDWPGNIRELRHAFDAAALLAGDDPIAVRHLPAEIVNPQRPRVEDADPEAPGALFGEAAQKQVESRLTRLLQVHAGNITAVASAMRTSRSQVHRWLKRFRIDVTRFGPPRGS